MLQQFLYRNKLYSQVYRNTEQLWETYFAIQSNYNQILHFQQTAMVFFHFYARKTQISNLLYIWFDNVFFVFSYLLRRYWQLRVESTQSILVLYHLKELFTKHFFLPVVNILSVLHLFSKSVFKKYIFFLLKIIPWLPFKSDLSNFIPQSARRYSIFRVSLSIKHVAFRFNIPTTMSQKKTFWAPAGFERCWIKMKVWIFLQDVNYHL